MDFCEKMMGKREKEADFLELEQPEGVPEVKEISKEKLNEKLKEIIDQPQYVKPIGENTLPPYYSREMSRYEPANPIKQKEREDLIEKVKEITSDESKGGKREKSLEVDTDLSWDHEGLKPFPKAPKDRLNESPKPPRAPKVPKARVNTEGTLKKEYSAFSGDSKEGKYSEPPHKENKDKKEVPPEKKQDPGIGKKSGKNDEKWDFESSENPVDKKTARWIEEQNEFLGKQKGKEFERNKKERDPPVFNPNGPIKVLQKPKATHHTGYEQPPQHLMGAQRDQAPHSPMVVTNRGDGSWRSQRKRYPLKERWKTQGVDMANNMGQVVKEEVIKLIELIEPKHRAIILLMGHKEKAVISQLKVLGMGKVEMGEVKMEMIKRSTETLGLIMKMIVMKRVIQKIPMSLR